MLTSQEISDMKLPSVTDDFIQLYQAVESSPNDFECWEKVLAACNDVAIELVRKVYSEFLDRFPLCYGYWKKFVEFERKNGEMSSPDTQSIIKAIYEKAVSEAAYCVDIWIQYTGFASFYMPKDEGREVFKRAIAKVGTDNKANKIWDQYLQFEASTGINLNVSLVYKQLLQTPFTHLEEYWNPYVTFAQQQPTEYLGDQTEITEITKRYEENPDNKYDSDTDRLFKIKQILLHDRKDIFDKTVAAFAAKKQLETAIKRSFFHVKAVSESDISTWNTYLDLKETEEDHESTMILYERALIPLCLYTDIWNRYILWAHHNMGIDKAIEIVKRAIRFLPTTSSLVLQYISLLEEKGDFVTVDQQLDTLLNTTAPGLLEAYIYKSEYLRRQGKGEEGEKVILDLINKETSTSSEISFLCLYLNNYYVNTLQDVNKARDLYQLCSSKCPDSPAFWKSFMLYEYQNSCSPASSLKTLLTVILASTLTYNEKKQLYERYIEYITFISPIKDINEFKCEFYIWKQQNKEKTIDSHKRSVEVASTASGVSMSPAVPIPTTLTSIPTSTMPSSMPPVPASMSTTPYPYTMPTGTQPVDPQMQQYYQYYYQNYATNYQYPH